MPEIGDKVKIKFRNGQEIVGTLVNTYTSSFIYLHIVVKLDSGETIDLAINDYSSGVSCVETLEE